MLQTRSCRLVVAADTECGWRGMPTQQFSRKRISRRRKLPALAGTSGPRLLNTPIMADELAHPSDRLIPAGTQSGLSRRSTVIRPSSGSTLTVALRGTPSGSRGKPSCLVVTVRVAFGSRPIASTIRCSLRSNHWRL